MKDFSSLCTLLEVSHRQSAKSWGVFQLFNFRLTLTWSTEPTPLHPTKPQNMHQVWVIASSPHGRLEVLGACFQRQESCLGLLCGSWPCSGFLGTPAQWGMVSGTCVPLSPWGVCAGGMPVTLLLRQAQSGQWANSLKLWVPMASSSLKETSMTRNLS